jgi:hypothetical protein
VDVAQVIERAQPGQPIQIGRPPHGGAADRHNFAMDDDRRD